MGRQRTRHRQNAPQSTGIIVRPRLLQRLKGAFDHRLTLITAPPGFGKTTVIAQLIDDEQATAVWHTLDERSRDLPNLYNQAIKAIASVLPSITQLAPPFGYSPSELATLITDHLADNTTGDLLYVLDDVHQLTGAGPAENWLRAFVSQLPANWHLILASRTLPRLPAVELIARGEILAIGLDQLRFTTEEIKELGAALLGTEPPREQVQQVATRLEGWPAGTVLAFQPLPLEPEDPKPMLDDEPGTVLAFQPLPLELQKMALSGQEQPEALFAFLARLMLQSQPLSVRNFLLASSTLSFLSPEVCTDALGLSNSTSMLAEIQNRNLFVTRLPGGLVYHTLFRDYLQAELKKTSADWFTDLHTRAARYFEAIDQPEQAFDHYMSADLSESAAAIAEHLAIAYFIQNRVETILSWNDQLRQSEASAPRLAFRTATICIERYDFDGAEEQLRHVEAIRSETDPETSLAAIRIQYGLIHVLRGNAAEAERYVSDLVNAQPEPTNIRGRALNVLGLARLQLGQAEAAITHFQDALPLYRIFADSYAQAQLLHNMVMAYRRTGRLADALSTLHEVIALQRSMGGVGPLAMALNSLGYFYHQLGDNEHAIAALQDGLNAIARFPNRRAQSYLRLNLGVVRRDQGDMETALNLFNQALEGAGEDEPSLTCTVLYCMSTLHRWRGEHAEAVAAAESAVRLSTKHKVGYENRAARFSLWTAQASTHPPEQVLHELELLAAEFEAQQERLNLLEAQGLCAYIALLAGKPDTTRQYLNTASRLGKSLGTMLPIAMEALYVPALGNFIRRYPDHYSDLLAALDQAASLQTHPQGDQVPTIAQRPQVIYSLRIITLGQARVKQDGHEIPTSRWRPAARDLFFYIFFNGRTSRDHICLDFWPDGSLKQVRANFHSTLHRVREVLGENAVIAYDDSTYGVNPDLQLSCDAQELESLATQARILPIGDARTEDLWRQAVNLYNGDFLPSLDMEWAMDLREHLRETHVESLLSLGHCVQTRSEYREALELYKRALDLEPYREEIHQAIMTCHITKGDEPQARLHLNELRRLLREELGIEPSKETLELVSNLHQ